MLCPRHLRSSLDHAQRELSASVVALHVHEFEVALKADVHWDSARRFVNWITHQHVSDPLRPVGSCGCSTDFGVPLVSLEACALDRTETKCRRGLSTENYNPAKDHHIASQPGH